MARSWNLGSVWDKRCVLNICTLRLGLMFVIDSIALQRSQCDTTFDLKDSAGCRPINQCASNIKSASELLPACPLLSLLQNIRGCAFTMKSLNIHTKEILNASVYNHKVMIDYLCFIHLRIRCFLILVIKFQKI